MIIVTYVAIISMAIIGVYAACRAIDSHFINKETAVKSVYKAGVMQDTIEHACEEINWMTSDMIKNINDQLQNMFKVGD